MPMIERVLEQYQKITPGRLRVMAKVFGLNVDYYFPTHTDTVYGVEDSNIAFSQEPSLSRKDIVTGSVIRERLKSDRSLDNFLGAIGLVRETTIFLPPDVTIPLDTLIVVHIGTYVETLRVHKIEAIHGISKPIYQKLILRPYDTVIPQL